MIVIVTYLLLTLYFWPCNFKKRIVMFALQNEKRIGWTNVGELENCVHFKIGKMCR